jgi:bifunctional DNA-binding transcriptional regulator/antitoxin component of YhaV-PrlF toxin-antitoxin module
LSGLSAVAHYVFRCIADRAEPDKFVLVMRHASTASESWAPGNYFTSCHNRKAMSKVSRKHQLTLPVRVLKDAGLAAGDEVVIRVVGRGRIEVERAEDVIDRYAGSLPAGTYPHGHLDQLRDEWRE